MTTDRTDSSRRLMRLRCGRDLLQQFSCAYREWKYLNLPTDLPAVPADAEIVDINYAYESCAWYVTLRHPSFEPVPDGGIIPAIPGPENVWMTFERKSIADGALMILRFEAGNPEEKSRMQSFAEELAERTGVPLILLPHGMELDVLTNEQLAAVGLQKKWPIESFRPEDARWNKKGTNVLEDINLLDEHVTRERIVYYPPGDERALERAKESLRSRRHLIALDDMTEEQKEFARIDWSGSGCNPRQQIEQSVDEALSSVGLPKLPPDLVEGRFGSYSSLHVNAEQFARICGADKIDATCPDCKGTGIYHGLNESEACQKCGGKGTI